MPLHIFPKVAIEANDCVCPAYAGHPPKAFQIVQKYKFGLQKLIFGVCPAYAGHTQSFASMATLGIVKNGREKQTEGKN